MTTRRDVLKLVATGVICLGVGYGLGYLTAPRPSPSPEAAKTPIKIGVICPLSPPGDYGAGALIRRGALLAKEYINKEMGGLLGRYVDIVIDDSSGVPEKGVAAAERLITQEKVVGITGLYHSSVALAVQDVCERHHVPMITMQAAAAKITERHYRYTFRAHAINPDRNKVILNWAKSKGWKRIAVIAEDTDYGVGIVDNIKKIAPEMIPGSEILDIIFPRTVTDLTPQLLEIKDWGPDLVYNVGVGAAAYLIIEQAYDIGLFPSTPMIGSYDFPLKPDFWESVGEKGVGIYFISYYHPQMEMTDLGKWAFNRYKELYNELPVYSTLNEFGVVLILAQAIEQAGSDDPEAITDALIKGTFVSWNSDKVTFPEGEGIYWHQFSIPMLILQFTEKGQGITEARIEYSG